MVAAPCVSDSDRDGDQERDERARGQSGPAAAVNVKTSFVE